MSLSEIFALILGTAEEIVPIFVHNPKSQQIESAVVTTTNALLQEFAAIEAATGPATATGTVAVPKTMIEGAK